MKSIYVYTNKINGHQYVGQTVNLRLRHNGHKSDSNNKNSHSYNYPLHGAIRKYGLENFTFEEIENNLTQEEANEREIYWIKELKSHISQGGYNISPGGNQQPRKNLTWEELKNKGRLFRGEEIEDIQNMLLDQKPYKEILQKYKERLTLSFLSNLNNGANFKNPSLNYPLKTNFSQERTEKTFSKETMKEIKEDIKKGITYAKICEKYNIQSQGFISMINTGKYYYDPNETYPLKLKGCADKSWIKECLYDIIFSTLSLVEVAKKHKKAESTVKKLAQGRTNKQEHLIYPIRQNLEKNKKIFKEYFN